MATVLVLADDSAAPSWSRALRWLIAGMRLWRRMPFALFALALLPVAFEALCQAAPVVGIVVSKLLTPLVSAWALAMLDQKARYGAFAARAVSRRWAERLPALAGVAALTAGVFAFQLGVAASLGGMAQAVALALGRMDAIELSRAQIALVLASGLLSSAPLMFLLPRVLLDGIGVIEAVRESASCVWRYRRPAGLLIGFTAALIAAMPWWPWVLIVLLPLGLCVGYATYRDVFDPAVE